MLTGRPVGEGFCSLGRLHHALTVGRTHLEPAVARGERHGGAPLPPRVERVLGGEVGFAPLALVDTYLDPLDAAMLSPGDAGYHHVPRRDVREWLGGVDPRLGLDRRLLGPSAPDPVRVEGLERRELEVDHP